MPAKLWVLRLSMTRLSLPVLINSITRGYRFAASSRFPRTASASTSPRSIVQAPILLSCPRRGSSAGFDSSVDEGVLSVACRAEELDRSFPRGQRIRRLQRSSVVDGFGIECPPPSERGFARRGLATPGAALRALARASVSRRQCARGAGRAGRRVRGGPALGLAGAARPHRGHATAQHTLFLMLL